MSTSDTPETDAAMEFIHDRGMTSWVPYDHACRLERERNQAIAERESNGKMAHDAHIRIEELKRERDEARSEAELYRNKVVVFGHSQGWTLHQPAELYRNKVVVFGHSQGWTLHQPAEFYRNNVVVFGHSQGWTLHQPLPWERKEERQ